MSLVFSALEFLLARNSPTLVHYSKYLFPHTVVFFLLVSGMVDTLGTKVRLWGEELGIDSRLKCL